MVSPARENLALQLGDFDELMAARNAICPAGAGRPAARQGAAVIRGAILLLAAAFEAYVEDVYDDAVDLIYASHTAAERKRLKDETSRRLHNADVRKVDHLFFSIGIPWIMSNSRIHWRKFSNGSVRSRLDEMYDARNSNAHGKPKAVRKPTALAWRRFVERLADRIDVVVGDRVEHETGMRPW